MFQVEESEFVVTESKKQLYINKLKVLCYFKYNNKKKRVSFISTLLSDTEFNDLRVIMSYCVTGFAISITFML